ncbi:UDP-N-acetylglucosamine transferase subunit ALG14 homolog [Meleagris gallopavo]|uniref:UDP-N-acetylglucosamine transferase subunit ALG14 homolog n=1 Tax=Meleagris gallopavo TaxID=9103 RepID=UPI000549B128|nr:UDP-N-acetylglucosamine transferase subunit ALG14 homolog [Meleagris gallopavo]
MIKSPKQLTDASSAELFARMKTASFAEISLKTGSGCGQSSLGLISSALRAFHTDGGHTTEILRLLSCLSESYSPRCYILADSDKMSEAKIRSFEQKRAERFSNSQFTLDRIPRSREVRQSWTSSVVTTAYSILYSLPLTYRLKPDLILCNGPGTCVPVCISALLLGLLGMKRAIIVYVESICRVETLSLSGKILYYFSDYFIVQWPALKEKYPKSVYLGRIV